MPVISGAGSVPALAVATVALTSGNITTSSATFVDVTGATVTLTTGARRCLVTVSGSWQHSVQGDLLAVDIAVDGTRQGGTSGLQQVACPGNAFQSTVALAFVTSVLTAASHTIKVQWRTNAATATIYADTTSPFVLSVVELLQST